MSAKQVRYGLEMVRFTSGVMAKYAVMVCAHVGGA
jgi:hypothetical protein